MRDKHTAGFVAIFFGGLGVHKFYLGRISAGVVYLLFCWSGIPSVLGIIEGVSYLTMPEKDFDKKYLTSFEYDYKNLSKLEFDRKYLSHAAFHYKYNEFR